MSKTKEKYKATKDYDVDAFDNYEGLGADNHAKLSRGKVVELESEPVELITKKMIIKVKGGK